MTTANDYKSQARAAKAYRLVEHFSAGCDQLDIELDQRPDLARVFTAEERIGLAKQADVKPPSDETWELVVFMLQTRADLQGRDPFDGLT